MSQQVPESADSIERSKNLGMSAKNFSKQLPNSQENPSRNTSGESAKQKFSNEEVMASIADLKKIIAKQSILNSSKSLKNMSKSSMYSRN